MSSTDSNLPASVTTTGSSPFDQIRRQNETGEYWSARDLQPVMSYDKWENFLRVVERAIRAAENTGTYSDQSFSRVREEVTGGAPRIDYHLSRQAAYLVAMNGDPNKPSVAAAQAYFAAQTRNAEILQMPTHAVALRGWAAELEAKEAAEKRAAELTAVNEVLAPKAGKWDAFMNADGLIGMTELADIIKTSVQKMTTWLVELDIFRKQTSQRGGCRNMPRITYQRSGHFEVKIETNNGINFPTAYATSEGVDLIVDHWENRSAA